MLHDCFYGLSDLVRDVIILQHWKEIATSVKRKNRIVQVAGEGQALYLVVQIVSTGEEGYKGGRKYNLMKQCIIW